MTAWYSASDGGVFRVGRGEARGRCDSKNHRPDERCG